VNKRFGWRARRIFCTPDVLHGVEMHLPRVWAEIDLDVIAQNFARCRSALSEIALSETVLSGKENGTPASATPRILGVVKANAYGHGASPVAQVLSDCGATMLGVGDSHEAIHLREQGISAPILVLGAVVDGEIPDLVEHDVTPTIHSPERIDVFEQYARSIGRPIRLHLLVDTGMALLGVTPARALDYVTRITESPYLELVGIGTHFSSPKDQEFTDRQLARFDRLIDGASRRGLPLPLIHAVASQTLIRRPDSIHDMVLLGGLLYGLRSFDNDDLELSSDTAPALSLRSQIVHLRDVDAGTRVSYDGTYVAERRTRIATLSVGYHDGYPHQLSNRAEVLVLGQRAPVVGRVTMDYTLVDVTGIEGAKVGDRATLIGQCGDEEIQTEDLAALAGSIPYEIPSRLGPRVLRRYHQQGVSWSGDGAVARVTTPSSLETPVPDGATI